MKLQAEYKASLHKLCCHRGNRKGVRDGLAYLESRFTGETRRAIRHQVELQLRSVYRNCLLSR